MINLKNTQFFSNTKRVQLDHNTDKINLWLPK